MVRKAERGAVHPAHARLPLEQVGDGTETAAWICSRHSISPKLLAPPGPDEVEIEMMIRAAVSAPDHGRLRPWRFIRIANSGRDALGELFAEAQRRKNPDCTEAELERERDRAARAPVLLAAIARINRGCDIPEREQLISVGAAIQNILLVAHALGYGTRIVSGAKTRDRDLCSALGLAAAEELVGFVCIGSATRSAKPARRPSPLEHLSSWDG